MSPRRNHPNSKKKSTGLIPSMVFFFFIKTSTLIKIN
jgi:hypothetical protein